MPKARLTPHRSDEVLESTSNENEEVPTPPNVHTISQASQILEYLLPGQFLWSSIGKWMGTQHRVDISFSSSRPSVSPSRQRRYRVPARTCFYLEIKEMRRMLPYQMMKKLSTGAVAMLSLLSQSNADLLWVLVLVLVLGLELELWLWIVLLMLMLMLILRRMNHNLPDTISWIVLLSTKMSDFVTTLPKNIS